MLDKKLIYVKSGLNNGLLSSISLKVSVKFSFVIIIADIKIQQDF